LLDVANDNLSQQTAILELTQQRVSAGLENTARRETVGRQSRADARRRGGGAGEHPTWRAISSRIWREPAPIAASACSARSSRRRPTWRYPRCWPRICWRAARTWPRRVRRWRPRLHGVAAAQADFYPNVNLMAFCRLQSIGLSQLFEASDRIVGAGRRCTCRFQPRASCGGVLQRQQAQLDESVAQYNQTLLDAVREVADVVANWRALERESGEQQIALEAAQRSYELTSERYRAGLDNYLSVLSSQNQVLQAQGLRAQLQARRLSFSVDLVRALGGGYSPRSSPT